MLWTELVSIAGKYAKIASIRFDAPAGKFMPGVLKEFSKIWHASGGSEVYIIDEVYKLMREGLDDANLSGNLKGEIRRLADEAIDKLMGGEEALDEATLPTIKYDDYLSVHANTELYKYVSGHGSMTFYVLNNENRDFNVAHYKSWYDGEDWDIKDFLSDKSVLEVINDLYQNMYPYARKIVYDEVVNRLKFEGEEKDPWSKEEIEEAWRLREEEENGYYEGEYDDDVPW